MLHSFAYSSGKPKGALNQYAVVSAHHLGSDKTVYVAHGLALFNSP
jgi:hypothetical protein